jgi:transcriptional regulator with XRE-family HTH domain
MFKVTHCYGKVNKVEGVYNMLKDRLLKLRKEKKRTQEDVAKVIGVSRPAYTAYEKGNRTPDYGILQTLAEYFGVTTDYLLGHSDDPQGTNKEEREKQKDGLMEILKDAPEGERERIKKEALAYAKYLADTSRRD